MKAVILDAFHRSGLSILGLSKRSNVPYASCYDTVTGQRDPALSTAAKLCEALGLELSPVRRTRPGKGAQ